MAVPVRLPNLDGLPATKDVRRPKPRDSTTSHVRLLPHGRAPRIAEQLRAGSVVCFISLLLARRPLLRRPASASAAWRPRLLIRIDPQRRQVQRPAGSTPDGEPDRRHAGCAGAIRSASRYRTAITTLAVKREHVPALYGRIHVSSWCQAKSPGVDRDCAGLAGRLNEDLVACVPVPPALQAPIPRSPRRLATPDRLAGPLPPSFLVHRVAGDRDRSVAATGAGLAAGLADYWSSAIAPGADRLLPATRLPQCATTAESTMPSYAIPRRVASERSRSRTIQPSAGTPIARSTPAGLLGGERRRCPRSRPPANTSDACVWGNSPAGFPTSRLAPTRHLFLGRGHR